MTNSKNTDQGEFPAPSSSEAPAPGHEGAPALPEQSISAWRDFLGITASLACAVHCAAMPFLIAYLPALGLSFLADESFHQWMSVACLVLALMAFIPGWRKHRRWLPGMIAGLGLLMISAIAFAQTDEGCPACAAAAAADTAENEALIAQESTQNDSCQRDCCQTATTANSSTDEAAVVAPVSVQTSTVVPFTVLSAMAVWWTPLGGMLLVSAHLLNRRYACCSCCPPETCSGNELSSSSPIQA